MAKQNLDGAQVSAGFQHGCGEAVSKQMGRNALADAGALIFSARSAQSGIAVVGHSAHSTL
jgi:hypothetical protein